MSLTRWRATTSAMRATTEASRALGVPVVAGRDDPDACRDSVRWSFSQGGTPRSCKGVLTQVLSNVSDAAGNIPAALVTSSQTLVSLTKSYVIVADVSYAYKPIVSQTLTFFAGPLSKSVYMVPRAISTPVNLQNPVNPGTNQSGAVCTGLV